jgi:DNA-3-methyladenine glycosylase I
MGELIRCPWPSDDRLMIEYHDQEWGVPVHEDRKLFEFLVLDAAQAGLSWKTVLHKRENYREAFAQFDPEKVALYGEPDIARLLANPGIIRNRLKIQSAIHNARAFLRIVGEFGTFDSFIWAFVGGETICNGFSALSDIPSRSPESDAMSRELRKRGFQFVGTVICYAFMQAAGMVNDHLVDCFRYGQLGGPGYNRTASGLPSG